MNRKGFTLIEVLAVIVILGIILVIAGPSILNVYKDSKLKSERIFIERLSQSIDGYIKLNSSNIIFNWDDDTKKYIGKIQKESELINIKVIDILNDKLISSTKNPGTKNPCDYYTEIEVYRDSDYVYCYKVKKERLKNCLTDTYYNSIGNYVIDTCME